MLHNDEFANAVGFDRAAQTYPTWGTLKCEVNRIPDSNDLLLSINDKNGDHYTQLRAQKREFMAQQQKKIEDGTLPEDTDSLLEWYSSLARSCSQINPEIIPTVNIDFNGRLR